MVTGLAGQDPVAADISRRAGRASRPSLLAAARDLPDAVLTATGGLLAAAPVAEALAGGVEAAGRSLTAPLGGALEGTHVLARHLLDTGGLPEHAAYLLLA